MFLDTSKLAGGSSVDTVVDPRKLFHALPENSYQYLRDVQGQVLEKWHQRRDSRDLVLKMNTGSGKTVVGLLALKSSLNEGVGPAAYVCPDNYLVEQVLAEAKALGISATKDPRSSRFQRGKDILVTNIKKVINGRSVFGVGHEGAKIEIGTIIVDDAHACLSDAEGQFALSFSRADPQYDKLYRLFSDDLRAQSEVAAAEVEYGDPRALMLVPYWAWLDRQKQVVEAILSDGDHKAVRFAWPLIKDHLALCRCVFGADSLEVAPLCPPASAIPALASAKRRIFMTATLSDDSVLVRVFDADPDTIANPVNPDTASDIGDRMILVPQDINPDVYDDDVKKMLVEFSATYNVVVIVPSWRRAAYWTDVAAETLSSDNLWEGVKRLKEGHVGLVVLVNKYDGVDLPGGACRILVLDGLPEALRLHEQVEKAVLLGGDAYRARQIQRIEQGMGRGVRSNDDYCAVILNGARLTQQLYSRGAAHHFSAATRAQLKLSEQVSDQIEEKGLGAVQEALAVILGREGGWVKAAKNALIDLAYPDVVEVSAPVVCERNAFDAAVIGRFDKAAEAMQRAVDAAEDPKHKAWLLHLMAEYVQRIDPVRSQSVLASAAARGPVRTKPLEGMAYKALNSKAMDQAREASQYFKHNFVDPNQVRVELGAIISDLTFLEDTAEEFEQAWMELAGYVGFRGQRPEKEIGEGPDGLWAVEDGSYLVVSCKNGATNPAIAKRYADELSGSMNWFRGRYDKSSGVPVIIHPERKFDSQAFPPEGTRVLDRERLERLKKGILSFVEGVINSDTSPENIRELLVHHKLTGSAFVNTYTVPAIKAAGPS